MGMGIGGWGLGIGDWAQSPIPNPQSPIPNPQSPKYKFAHIIFKQILKFKKIKFNSFFATSSHYYDYLHHALIAYNSIPYH